MFSITRKVEMIKHDKSTQSWKGTKNTFSGIPAIIFVSGLAL